MSILRPNVLSSPGYVPGEQPTDPAVIKLNTNENPYPPSPKVLDAIHAISPEQLRKYPSPSGQPFREAAAKVHNLTPDHILPFNGGDELLSVAIRSAASEHDSVAFLEPSYSLYPVLTQMNGSPALKLSYDITEPSQQIENRKSKIENPTWQLPPDIENTPAKILLIVNPNAPSGHLDPLDRLSHIAQNFKGLLLIDEAYVDFAPHSARPLVQKHANVLLLRTLSKGYSLAGLRFGYAIAKPSLLKQIEKVRDSYPVDAISIAAATAAISDQPYASETWQKVIAERTRLAAALRERNFTLPDSHSNFLLATAPQNAKLTAQQLYESLKARNILVRWWNLPRIADKIRITVGTPEQNSRLLAELDSLPH
ncbi:MAG: histidinol-phosphate transaminase [Phycisphaerae bacterium]